MMDWSQLGSVAVQTLVFTLTLTFLLVGLFGLLIPIFPGIAVMWLAVLIYALVQAAVGNMSQWDWALFAIITILAAFGGVVDNIIIAAQVRKTNTPWSSILISGAVGLIASLFLTPLIALVVTPAVLYVVEFRRLQDRHKAFDSMKAWLIGFGWTFAALFGIGLLIIILWFVWIWY